MGFFRAYLLVWGCCGLWAEGCGPRAVGSGGSGWLGGVGAGPGRDGGPRHPLGAQAPAMAGAYEQGKGEGDIFFGGAAAGGGGLPGRGGRGGVSISPCG